MTKGIIFDLDGTLVDTLDDLTVSMNYGLSRVGRPERTRNECRQMIGSGILKFAEAALGPEYVHLAEDVVKAMVAHYKDHCLSKTTPYPGIPEVVGILQGRGVAMAVVTNKDQDLAETITRHFFGDVFSPIVGTQNGKKPKPDPQAALNILEQWNLRPDQVLFVGDGEPDVQTANAAGIKCLACEWGFRSKEQLLAAGAEIFIQQPGQILEYIG